MEKMEKFVYLQKFGDEERTMVFEATDDKNAEAIAHYRWLKGGMLFGRIFPNKPAQEKEGQMGGCVGFPHHQKQ